MSDEFHARVKAVFTEAIGAPSSERIAFRVCRGDAALREQVDVVLDNHVPGSIIGQKLGSDPVPRPPRARRKTASTIGAELSRVLGGRYRRPALVVTVALGLIALGQWTHGRVEESLRRIRRDDLRAVLTADVTALEVWIRQQKILVRQWAQEPGLQPLAFRLMQHAEAGATVEKLR